VIRSAIGRWQVTITNRDEQSVIGSLQSAHNAESARLATEDGRTGGGAQMTLFCGNGHGVNDLAAVGHAWSL
jgi:hypothetical protein